MTVFFDKVASVLTALFTIVICGLPAWFTHVAIQGGLAPTWGYVPAVALAAIGLILGFAFGRKAARGIAPSRQRRR